MSPNTLEYLGYIAFSLHLVINQCVARTGKLSQRPESVCARACYLVSFVGMREERPRGRGRIVDCHSRRGHMRRRVSSPPLSLSFCTRCAILRRVSIANPRRHKFLIGRVVFYRWCIRNQSIVVTSAKEKRSVLRRSG